MVESFSSDGAAFRTPSNINDGSPLRKQPTTFTCRLLYQKSSNTDFRLTQIWLEVLWMWSVGGLQVHGIRSRRLLYREVVEVWSNYKGSYFWWFENPTCGDLTRSNRIEKNQRRVSAKFVWGKRGEWAVWFSACGTHSDDWADGGYVDVLFTCGVVLVFWGAGRISGNKYGI